MGYRRVSKDIKERSIYLSTRPDLCSNVEEALAVSRASVNRWQLNVETYGSVERPRHGLVGRPAILDSYRRSQLRDHLLTSPERYLDEIALWLGTEHNAPISRSTLSRNMQEVGFTHQKLRLQAIQRDEEEILAWKEDTAQMFTADQLISIDESSKDGRTLYRRHGWGLKGQTPVRTVDFPRGERWSLLPALTINGYIAKRVVQGSVDAASFLDFILEDVLPYMNPFPLPQSVLLMDNCAIHKLERLRVAVESKGCRIHFLPPYAPELNPIEESFAAVKSMLRRDSQRLGQLEDSEALLEACETVTAEKAKGWFQHSGYY